MKTLIFLNLKKIRSRDVSTMLHNKIFNNAEKFE